MRNAAAVALLGLALAVGADPAAGQQDGGHSAVTERLFEAVRAGDLGTVQGAVLDDADLAAVDKEGRTPLALARELGHGTIAGFLAAYAQIDAGGTEPAAAPSDSATTTADATGESPGAANADLPPSAAEAEEMLNESLEETSEEAPAAAASGTAETDTPDTPYYGLLDELNPTPVPPAKPSVPAPAAGVEPAAAAETTGEADEAAPADLAPGADVPEGSFFSDLREFTGEDASGGAAGIEPGADRGEIAPDDREAVAGAIAEDVPRTSEQEGIRSRAQERLASEILERRRLLEDVRRAKRETWSPEHIGEDLAARTGTDGGAETPVPGRRDGGDTAYDPPPGFVAPPDGGASGLEFLERMGYGDTESDAATEDAAAVEEPLTWDPVAVEPTAPDEPDVPAVE